MILLSRMPPSRGQGQRHLRVVEIHRWTERLVDPAPQIAVDEQLVAQQGDQIGQAPGPGAAQLQIAQHDYRDHCRRDPGRPLRDREPDTPDYRCAGAVDGSAAALR